LGYFLSISQQAVSADIIKNSAVGNIMQRTRKGFEECVREETAHLAILKSKKYIS
jgi:hypothetical protein